MKDIPAFPVNELNAHEGLYAQHFGMTLRDYFAAKAMQCMHEEPRVKPYSNLDYKAEVAYQMADAMLKAREAK